MSATSPTRAERLGMCAAAAQPLAPEFCLAISSIRRKEKLADVVLVATGNPPLPSECEQFPGSMPADGHQPRGHVFFCHSAVLCGRCPYFVQALETSSESAVAESTPMLKELPLVQAGVREDDAPEVAPRKSSGVVGRDSKMTARSSIWRKQLQFPVSTAALAYMIDFLYTGLLRPVPQEALAGICTLAAEWKICGPLIKVLNKASITGPPFLPGFEEGTTSVPCRGPDFRLNPSWSLQPGVCHTHRIVLDSGRCVPVHAAVLAAHSGFFAQLFEGGWKESVMPDASSPPEIAAVRPSCDNEAQTDNDDDDNDYDDSGLKARKIEHISGSHSRSACTGGRTGGKAARVPLPNVPFHGCSDSAFAAILSIMYTGTLTECTLFDTSLPVERVSDSSCAGKQDGVANGFVDGEELNLLELLHFADYLQTGCVRGVVIDSAMEVLTVENVCSLWNGLFDAGASLGDLEPARDFFISNINELWESQRDGVVNLRKPLLMAALSTGHINARMEWLRELVRAWAAEQIRSTMIKKPSKEFQTAIKAWKEEPDHACCWQCGLPTPVADCTYAKEDSIVSPDAGEEQVLQTNRQTEDPNESLFLVDGSEQRGAGGGGADHHVAKKFQRCTEDFDCGHCGFRVQGNGFTNHCPQCLWSAHVDINPGDRAASCRALMEPIAVDNGKKSTASYRILQRCVECGHERWNRQQDIDDFEAILRVSKEQHNNEKAGAQAVAPRRRTKTPRGKGGKNSSAGNAGARRRGGNKGRNAKSSKRTAHAGRTSPHRMRNSQRHQPHLQQRHRENHTRNDHCLEDSSSVEANVDVAGSNADAGKKDEGVSHCCTVPPAVWCKECFATEIDKLEHQFLPPNTLFNASARQMVLRGLPRQRFSNGGMPRLPRP